MSYLLMLMLVCPLAVLGQFGSFPNEGGVFGDNDVQPSTTRPPVGGAGAQAGGVGPVGAGPVGAGPVAGGTSGMGGTGGSIGGQAGGADTGATAGMDDDTDTDTDNDDNDDGSGSGGGSGGGSLSYSYDYTGHGNGIGLLNSSGEKAGVGIACVVVGGLLVALAMFFIYKRQQRR